MHSVLQLEYSTSVMENVGMALGDALSFVVWLT